MRTMKPIQDRRRFEKIMDELIDAWCERRALKPLRIILPSWPFGIGLTDDWHRIREALRHTPAMARDVLTAGELDQLNQLIAAVDQALY